jgi:hypothetical protein
MNTLTYCTIRTSLYDEPLEERFLSIIPAIGDHMTISEHAHLGHPDQQVYRVQHRIWTPSRSKKLPGMIREHVAHVSIIVVPASGDPWTAASEKAMQLIRAGLDVHGNGGATKEELLKYMNEAIEMQDGDLDWPGEPNPEEPPFCPECAAREANNGDG